MTVCENDSVFFVVVSECDRSSHSNLVAQYIAVFTVITRDACCDVASSRYHMYREQTCQKLSCITS